MLNVLLLHHDLEWTEERLIELRPNDRLRITPRDIRQVDMEDIRQDHVLLNRVYASVANRDFASVERALRLCEAAAAAGVRCVNSVVGCRADYDKRFAAARLRDAGVATPETLPVDFGREEVADQIRAAMDRFAGPVVFKRNTGGRALDVFLVARSDQVRAAAEHARRQRGDYPGEWIIQEYAENVRGFDCRVAIVRGRPVFAYGRTLVNPDGAGGRIGFSVDARPSPSRAPARTLTPTRTPAPPG